MKAVTTKKNSVKKNSVPSNGGKGKPHGSATAAAILGQTATPGAPNGRHAPKIRAEWDKYYQNLIELRERLLSQMSGLAKESAEEMSSYSLHMADSGTDNFDRDFALSLLSSDQDAIYEIEEALKRIERDTYGVCELTGKADSQGPAGCHPLDPLHRGSPGPTRARWRIAPAPPGRPRHRGQRRRQTSIGRRRRAEEKPPKEKE